MPDFETYRIPLEARIEAVVTWPVESFRPPLVILPMLFLVAWRTAGWRLGAFRVCALTCIGFLEVWEETMTTLAMVQDGNTGAVTVRWPWGFPPTI